jgi:hypothetical protein
VKWIWSYPKTMGRKTARMLKRLRPDQRAFVLHSRSGIPALEAELSSHRRVV